MFKVQRAGELKCALQLSMDKPLRRVVVTGVGIVSPLGNCVNGAFQRLINGDSAIRQLHHDDLVIIFPGEGKAN